MTEDLLTVNAWSRPGSHLRQVTAIVVHWFGAPGQLATQVRDYWEARKDGQNGWGSAHIAIDDRQTILAIPLNEIAYHVGAEDYTEFALKEIGQYPNAHAIGVELAHHDWGGEPTPDVWLKTVSTLAYLCDRFGLPEGKIVTHWDVTGMRPYWKHPCHRWFVQHPGELARLRAAVRKERGLR